MTVTLTRWTLDDYHRMIESGILDGRAVELLNGEIVDMSPEGPEHAQRSTTAAEYLRELLGRQVLVRDAKPITLPETGSEPEPDLAIVQRLGEVYGERHPYPADVFWLIEYANTSLAKDLEVKRKTYATAGIGEYWVVNLKKKQLVVLRKPVGGDYRSEEILTEGVITTVAFPEVEIEVKKLLPKR